MHLRVNAEWIDVTIADSSFARLNVVSGGRLSAMDWLPNPPPRPVVLGNWPATPGFGAVVISSPPGATGVSVARDRAIVPVELRVRDSRFVNCTGHYGAALALLGRRLVRFSMVLGFFVLYIFGCVVLRCGCVVGAFGCDLRQPPTPPTASRTTLLTQSK